MTEQYEDFEKMMKENEKNDIDEIHLSTLTSLKIMDHIISQLPKNPYVRGSLLGLNVGKTLEITNCFPIEQKLETQFQTEMISSLFQLNVDSNQVGWYQARFLNSYFDLQTIEVQYRYQVEYGKRCVCIIFDPVRSLKEQLYFKAIRLSDKFMECIKKNFQLKGDEKAKKEAKYLNDGMPAVLTDNILKMTMNFVKKNDSNLTYQEIFEEIPIKVKNSAMVELFIQTEMKKYVFDNDLLANAIMNSFDLSMSSYSEQNIEKCLRSFHSLSNEQKKLINSIASKQYQNPKQKKFTQVTNVVPLMIYSNQIKEYCGSMETFAKINEKKLDLTNGLFEKGANYYRRKGKKGKNNN